MSGQIVHFELPVDDFDRASGFYGELFGWGITPMGPTSAMARTAPSDEYGRPSEPGAINGAFARRAEPISVPVLTIGVDDIDKTLERIQTLGGNLVQAKTPVGDIGFVAYFTDSESNTVGLWENAKS